MDYFKNIQKNMDEICESCINYGTEMCRKLRCNIGFTRYVMQKGKESEIIIIEDGKKLIPKEDMRYYEDKQIAEAIANICKLCKECKENHNENCIFSLGRRSLENTQIKEDIDFPGNIILYLINMSKENPKFAEIIKEKYMELS